MRSNGIYADYEKMAAEGGHRSQGGIAATNTIDATANAADAVAAAITASRGKDDHNFYPVFYHL